MIMRYLEDLEDQRIEGEGGGTETNPLLPAKTIPITYGTCGEDLETGDSSCSSSSSGSSNNTGTSSEDLYDGKVCVICYDEQRNCFFVPCGHCATCYVCAQRYGLQWIILWTYCMIHYISLLRKYHFGLQDF